MELYTFPPSPNHVRVMALINELGLPVDLVLLDLTKGETNTDEFKGINPNGKIPTLVDGETVVWESHAIMLYLAEKHDSKLLPKELAPKTEMNQWMCWNLAHFAPALGGVVWERVAPKMIEGYQADEHQLMICLQQMERFCPVLDQHLATRAFVTGDQPTLADLSLASMLVHKEMAQLPLDQYENLLTWYQRVAGLPYFKAALPKMPA